MLIIIMQLLMHTYGEEPHQLTKFNNHLMKCGNSGNMMEHITSTTQRHIKCDYLGGVLTLNED